MFNTTSRGFGAFFEEWDIILTPITALPTPKVGTTEYLTISDNPSVLDWFDNLWRNFAFTPLANLCGMPAISLPLAEHENGLPLGIQALARQANDGLLLQLAAQIERAIDGKWNTGRKPKVHATNGLEFRYVHNTGTSPLPFEALAEAIKGRRSDYGHISGLQLDRFAPAEAWSSLPYRPVFVGDTATGVLHGGVVTAMLDESCGMAVQLALDGARAIATLDLRIDYQKPATPGLDIKAHSVCYRATRSIAFVRSTAYQDSEDDPVATATACFMIGANRTNMLADRRWSRALPTLEAPDDPAGPFANSPFAHALGIRVGDDGTLTMPFSPKIIGNPILPAIHGGMTGAFLETSAIIGVTRELGVSPPKPIGLTVNYLRSGRALDSVANVSIVKQGRRVVAFEARAWQDDANKPIATAFGHFMLRQTPEGTRNRIAGNRPTKAAPVPVTAPRILLAKS